MREDETSEQESTLTKLDVHSRWTSDYRHEANELFFNECFDAILRDVDAPPGALFLDAGCGSASHSIRLALRGYRVEAFDFSESILAVARNNVAGRRLSNLINIRQGNLRALPYPDGNFDYILCWGVLMHVPAIDEAISELSRVLAPGGVLIVHEANADSLQSVTHRSLLRIGRKRRDAVSTEYGVESWKNTDAGKVMTRVARIPRLVQEFEKHGLRLRSVTPGQFTEAYVRISRPALQNLVHRVNRVWFRRGMNAKLAFSNVLIFDRQKI